MKSNQLLGALALMLAMGMTFPSPAIAEDEDRLSSSSVKRTSTGLLEALKEIKLAPENSGALLATSETTRRTRLSGKERDFDDKRREHKSQPLDTFPPTSSHPAEGLEFTFNPNAISNAAELTAAVNSDETQLTLSNDICLEHNLEINRDELILNLNGHKIIALYPNMRVLDIKRGDVTLMGVGEIIAYGEGSVAIRVYGALTQDMPAYAKVTIGERVALYAPTSYAIIISPNAINTAYGVEVTLKGQIIAHDGLYINGMIKGGLRAPMVTITDNAKITADGETGTAIYAAGYGSWEIGKAKIAGANGLSLETGEFKLSNTELVATGLYQSSTDDGGFNSITGSAFQLSPRPNRGELTLRLTGGRYTSAAGYVFFLDPTLDSAQPFKQLAIDRSMFSDVVVSGGLGIFNEKNNNLTDQSLISIKSGQFNADVNQFLAPELELEVSADGLYRVVDQSAEKLLASSRADLINLLEEIAALPSESYTATSYQALTTAVQTGQDLLRDSKTDRTSILVAMEAIKGVQSALELQVNELLNNDQAAAEPDPHPELTAARTALQTKVQQLSELDPMAYTPESYNVLASVVEAANALLENDDATQIALETSLHLLNVTEESLILDETSTNEPEMIDEDDESAIEEAKLRLDDALAAVRDLQPADFEDNFDFGALELLIERAGIALEDPEAVMSDLSDIIEDLVQAIKYLKDSPSELTLEEGLDDEDELAAVTTPQVTQTVTSPSRIYDSVETEPLFQPAPQPTVPLDWSALRDLISEIAQFEPGNYTETSYGRLLSELARASALLEDENATQSAIDDVVFDVNLAILSLEKTASSQQLSSNFGRPEAAHLDTSHRNHDQDAFNAKVATSSIFTSLAAAATAGLAAYRRNRRIQK